MGWGPEPPPAVCPRSGTRSTPGSRRNSTSRQGAPHLPPRSPQAAASAPRPSPSPARASRVFYAITPPQDLTATDGVVPHTSILSARPGQVGLGLQKSGRWGSGPSEPFRTWNVPETPAQDDHWRGLCSLSTGVAFVVGPPLPGQTPPQLPAATVRPTHSQPRAPCLALGTKPLHGHILGVPFGDQCLRGAAPMRSVPVGDCTEDGLLAPQPSLPVVFGVVPTAENPSPVASCRIQAPRARRGGGRPGRWP